jgi:hypothetical protein
MSIISLTFCASVVVDIPRGESDFRKFLQPFSTPQIGGIMRNGLGSQDAFAFAIHLNGELSEMNPEHRQIIDRFLDHDLNTMPFTFLITIAYPTLITKDGFYCTHIKRRSGTINNAIKHFVKNIDKTIRSPDSQYINGIACFFKNARKISSNEYRQG